MADETEAPKKRRRRRALASPANPTASIVIKYQARPLVVEYTALRRVAGFWVFMAPSPDSPGMARVTRIAVDQVVSITIDEPWSLELFQESPQAHQEPRRETQAPRVPSGPQETLNPVLAAMRGGGHVPLGPQGAGEYRPVMSGGSTLSLSGPMGDASFDAS